nr:MAG TPA: Ephrin type-A receptor 2 [Caudoviricetes sp.]
MEFAREIDVVSNKINGVAIGMILLPFFIFKLN